MSWTKKDCVPGKGYEVDIQSDKEPTVASKVACSSGNSNIRNIELSSDHAWTADVSVSPSKQEVATGNKAPAQNDEGLPDEIKSSQDAGKSIKSLPIDTGSKEESSPADLPADDGGIDEWLDLFWNGHRKKEIIHEGESNYRPTSSYQVTSSLQDHERYILQDDIPLDYSFDEGSDDDAYQRIKESLGCDNSCIITHSVIVCGKTVTIKSLVVERKMYIYVNGPVNRLHCSRTCFFSLLERADEELDCEYVIVIFPKSTPKSLLADIWKPYRIFGFKLLPPTDDLVPAHCNESNLFLAYELHN